MNWNIWRTKAWIGKHDFFWYKGIVLVKQIYFGCLNVLVFIFQINFFFKIFYFFRIYFSPAFILWGGIWLMPAGIYLYKFNNGSTRRMSMSSFWCLLYEKCSNRKFFSGPYFPVFGLNTEIYSVFSFEQISDIVFLFPFLTLYSWIPAELTSFCQSNISYIFRSLPFCFLRYSFVPLQ